LSICRFMVTVGYMIYAFSWSFTSVSIGFIILGFFNVFINAVSVTFFQYNFLVNAMGRVTSILQLIRRFGQIKFILTIDIIADLVYLLLTIVVLATLMFSLSIMFSIVILKENKRILPRRELI